MGLISHPNEADGVDTFDFGQTYMTGHDFCESHCESQPRCVAYTQFATWHGDVSFYAWCVGRSIRYNVNEVDAGTWSGINSSKNDSINIYGMYEVLEELFPVSEFICDYIWRETWFAAKVCDS